ncbi:putative transposase/invertase (TIGR01784 family) [Thermostichus sp. MS-CIW-40]
MAYDNVCKYLVEWFPESFARWLLGSPVPLIQLQPTELSTEPIRADSLILLRAQNLILHLEFQTDPDPDIPLRMADYCLRLYRRYPAQEVRQIVIYLRKTQSERVYQTSFQRGSLSHRFEVLRLWEQDPEVLSQYPGLLPLAVLADPENPEPRLRQVARAIAEMEDPKLRQELKAATAVLAGLTWTPEEISRVLGGLAVRESTIYQMWRAEALKEGREEGLKQGLEQGLQQEAARLTLSQLRRKLGSLPEDLSETIRLLPTEQLEALAEALLDFQTLADLIQWLRESSSN